jgi:hypothetical protein
VFVSQPRGRRDLRRAPPAAGRQYIEPHRPLVVFCGAISQCRAALFD